MGEKRKCPRCRGWSWVELLDRRPVQRCLCGFLVWLDTEPDRLLTPKVREVEIKVPTVGTKISYCLLAVRDRHPKELSTDEVCGITGYGRKEVAAMLSTLKDKGLVARTIKRRGTLGGSIWTLGENVIDVLKDQED